MNIAGNPRMITFVPLLSPVYTKIDCSCLLRNRTVHNRSNKNTQIFLLEGSDGQIMKDTIGLVDIAIRFCIATNEIGSCIIYEYCGFQTSLP